MAREEAAWLIRHGCMGASAEGMVLVHSRGAVDWPGGSDRSRGKLGDGACVQRYRHCS